MSRSVSIFAFGKGNIYFGFMNQRIVNLKQKKADIAVCPINKNKSYEKVFLLDKTAAS